MNAMKDALNATKHLLGKSARRKAIKPQYKNLLRKENQYNKS